MFRTVPLSIIRSFSLYTQQWYMSYSLRAPNLYIAVYTVKNSWWRTEKLSETCRVLFQKWIWEISASIWFYCKNLSRCAVTWTSLYHDARSPERQKRFEWLASRSSYYNPAVSIARYSLNRGYAGRCRLSQKELPLLGIDPWFLCRTSSRL